MDLEFHECDACSAKPGSPTLCGGCLHNRRVIGMLKGSLRMNAPPGKARPLPQGRGSLVLSMGWCCPACAVVYGPHIDECRRCSPKEAVDGNVVTVVHDEGQFTGNTFTGSADD